MNRLVTAIAIAVLMAAASASCVGPDSRTRSSYVEIDDAGWVYGRRIPLVPDTVDSVAVGTLSVALRHNNSFAYSNLWLEVCYMNNGVTKCDTLNVALADRYGRWHGQGFGASYQLEVPVARKIVLHKSDTVKVRHIMRVDTLRGVEQIGVAFARNKKR